MILVGPETEHYVTLHHTMRNLVPFQFLFILSVYKEKVYLFRPTKCGPDFTLFKGCIFTIT